jgi:hypothetical protein
MFLTPVDALATGDGNTTEAMLHINDVSRRNGLRERLVDRPPGRQTYVELIRDGYRADLDTFPTGGACPLIDKASLFEDLCPKITDVAFYLFDFTVRK